ncbi:PEP-CTERM sorting domain-containing protein [Luteolibacter flavescens]|uniref:PEP-CTERM sorting domain-containing protein n=1 Tax=Luteolibacter flavescens TaxID=1859460 RepID=A0ABT3FRV8_9BACT|nr:PEP-CTERM sorting domain-containing protein [Luteolibacter flavescens]MCW1886308.1 PEP-CTERM sorting domain-containing protein [Luteolibacter flavescens]
MSQHHILPLLGFLALASIAPGAVVINNSVNRAPAGGTPGAAHDPSTSGTPNQFSASSSDLIQGMTPTVTYTGGTGSPTTEGSAGSAVWTNGSITTVYGGVPDATAHAAYGVVNGTVGTSNIDTFVTYDLGSLFNLTEVNVFTGWNDSGRDDSSFNLLVSVDGITFSLIAGYAKGPDDTGTYTTPVTNRHSIVDDGGAAIATGVRFVQLQFTDSDNGHAGMLEVDVFGAAVPEPGAALLVGLGGLAAMARRRRG